MARLLFLIAWTAHGIGHVAGVTGPFVPVSGGFKADANWVLPGDVVVTSLVGKAWALVWLAALIATVASSYGLFVGAEWWRQAALVGAVLSIAAIAPWARTVPAGALLGVLLDVGVAVMLLVPMDGLLRLLEK